MTDRLAVVHCSTDSGATKFKGKHDDILSNHGQAQAGGPNGPTQYFDCVRGFSGSVQAGLDPPLGVNNGSEFNRAPTDTHRVAALPLPWTACEASSFYVRTGVLHATSDLLIKKIHLRHNTTKPAHKHSHRNDDRCTAIDMRTKLHMFMHCLV